MNFKKYLSNLLLVKVYADELTTAVATGGDNVLFSEAVRTVYSKEIEFKALPNMRFMQFAQIKTELGVEPGLTISMLTYDNLDRGGALTEGTDMTTQALSGSMKSITVGERGNAVSVSELLIQSSFDDVMASATNLLARDYAIVMDKELRDVALTGTNIVYARESDNTVVSSRAGLKVTSLFKVSTVKDAVEVMATNNTPKFEGNYYIAFVHPHQSRDLRDDAAWINASNYGNPTALFTGEIGRIDDTRFIETSLMCNGAVASTDDAYKLALVLGQDNAVVNVYQAVIFGEEYYGLAFSLPVELRDDGVTDFGRKHGLAWYSIWGTGKMHNDHGVVIESA